MQSTSLPKSFIKLQELYKQSLEWIRFGEAREQRGSAMPCLCEEVCFDAD